MVVINNQVEVVIIGGGLIGMLTAHALVKTGVRVVIIEKAESASESSWAGGGILSPLYPWRYPDAVNALAFKSQEMYESLAQEIFSESGIDPQYRRCGMHILADDVDAKAHQWLNTNHIPYIENETVKSTWNPHQDRRFLYLPQIAQIRNPRFIKSLKRALEKAGVEFSFNNAVSAFSKQDNGQFRVSTEKGTWLAGKLVVCAGAWTSKLLSPQALSQVINPSVSSAQTASVNIKPVRGQMLLYKAPETFISTIILAKGRYVIPREDGHVLVGSTMENVGFDKSTTEEGGLAIKHFVADICPDLSRYPVVRHWSGLRPGSPDGTPFIGEHPEIPDLYINSGHFRNGVVMAPASALLMRDLIQKMPPVVAPAAYSIALEKTSIA